MSVESTYTVKRSDAIEMLKRRNVDVFDNDCNERLSLLLYENRGERNEFENYDVVNDDFIGDQYERFKYYW